MSESYLPPGLPIPVPEPNGLSKPFWDGLRKDTITPADRAASLKLIAEGRALAKKREQKSAMEKINAARAVAKKILDKAAAKKAKPARARKAFSY